MAVDSDTQIAAGLRADIMRKRMENKDLLSSKGYIYVGTGNTDTVADETIHETVGLPVGTNEQVLISDSTTSEGIKWGQVTNNGIADNTIENAKLVNKGVTFGPTNSVDAQYRGTATIANLGNTISSIGSLSFTGIRSVYLKLGYDGSNISTNPVLLIPYGSIVIDHGNLTLNEGDIYGRNFYATSDKNLKENIIPFKYDKSILDLEVKEFDFKDSKVHSMGCIAQDLQEICPQIVKENEKGFLQIEENKIIYLLLEEMKRMDKRIKELEEK